VSPEQALDNVTARDLIVSEGRKPQVVESIAPMSAPMQLALVIDAELAGFASVHSAARAFISRLSSRAQIALVIAGDRDVVVVDYTDDTGALLGGVPKLLARATMQTSNRLAESIFETARSLGRSEIDRRVIVAIGVNEHHVLEMNPREILDELQKTGVTLFVAAIPGAGGPLTAPAFADAAGLDDLLSEGPTQSGGRLIETLVTSSIPDSLSAIADDIVHQYEVRYVLPPGVKPDEAIGVTSGNPNLLVRGPTRIPVR